jgi:hypothetical protein
MKQTIGLIANRSGLFSEIYASSEISRGTIKGPITELDSPPVSAKSVAALADAPVAMLIEPRQHDRAGKILNS